MTFKEWVEKHQIGPSMNQRYLPGLKGEEVPPGTLYSGFDGTVGVGWVPILDRLATDLKALGWTGSVEQIKEKFGTLRFYARADGVSPEQIQSFNDRIAQAERESATTCEDCGADGTHGPRSGGYWLKTLCNRCRNTPYSRPTWT